MISFHLLPKEPDPDQIEFDFGDLTTNKVNTDDVDIIWMPFDYDDIDFLVENNDYGLNTLFNEYSPYVTEGVCIGMDKDGDEYLGIGLIVFDEVFEVWSIRKTKPESYLMYEFEMEEST